LIANFSNLVAHLRHTEVNQFRLLPGWFFYCDPADFFITSTIPFSIRFTCSSV
jgi:hypothetical protein